MTRATAPVPGPPGNSCFKSALQALLSHLYQRGSDGDQMAPHFSTMSSAGMICSELENPRAGAEEAYTTVNHDWAVEVKQ